MGEQYVWEQKITGFDSYQDFISSMDFYDKKNGMAKINRDYDLRKRVVTPTLVDDYTCTDTIVQNGTIENECVVSGNHLEDRITYTPLKQVDFKKMMFYLLECILLLKREMWWSGFQLWQVREYQNGQLGRQI